LQGKRTSTGPPAASPSKLNTRKELNTIKIHITFPWGGELHIERKPMDSEDRALILLLVILAVAGLGLAFILTH
jgi:hypothetical protein